MPRRSCSRPRDNVDAALRRLRDRDDPEARTELLQTLRRLKGSGEALAWASEEGVGPPDLLSIGTFLIVTSALEADNFDAALDFARRAPAGHLIETPAVAWIKAQLEVAVLAPEARRLDLMRSVPLDPSRVPLAQGAAAERVLETAIADLGKLAETIGGLGLPEQKEVVLEYALWLRLSSRDARPDALRQLKDETSDPKTTLRRVRLAIDYGVPFDRAALAQSLRRKKEIGGWRAEERFAAFMIAYAGNDPREVSDFIAAHRDDLFGAPDFNSGGLVALEVQALAAAGDVGAARRAIAAYEGREIGAEQAHALREQLDTVEAGGELEAARLRYEATPDHGSLQVLVALCQRDGDKRGLAAYAPALARLTGTLNHLRLALNALLEADEAAAMAQLLGELPQLVALDDQLRAVEGWALCRAGRIPGAAPIAREMVAKRGAPQDFELAVQVAIEAGDWDFLQGLMDQALSKIDASRPGTSCASRASHSRSGAGPCKHSGTPPSPRPPTTRASTSRRTCWRSRPETRSWAQRPPIG